MSINPEYADFAAAIGEGYAKLCGFSIEELWKDYANYQSDSVTEAEHFESWLRKMLPKELA